MGRSRQSRSPAPSSTDAGALSRRPRALPLELSSFVGRERELAEIRSLLATTRLLTLTGPGGSGKTRLAREAVASAPADRKVVWVELASLGEDVLIPRAVAEAVGFVDEIRDGDLAALIPLLHERALLVLDNCEHLVDACAALAEAVLGGCPDLAILATSREPLGVRGERAWLVPPLGLPSPAGHEADGRPSEAESVRLFVERARETVPDFDLTPERRAAVAEICRALDGMPLAIELAAARVRVLSPVEISERLGSALDLLTDGGRTALPRHRTLRAAIDWSHALLPDEGRRLLRRLAVFRGGATLDAVEEVCAFDEAEGATLLDVLTRLVDRSLVQVREHDGRARYLLLEIVRQYALEALVASGDEPETRHRHARWFADLAGEAEPHLTRSERPAWVARLLPELDNLREALRWSRAHEPAGHVVLAGRLWWFWFSTAHWTEGGRWLTGALELPGSETPGRERASLLFARGALLALQADAGTARTLLREAADLARDVGDLRLEAYALNYLGMTHAGRGEPEALDLCGRAEAWFRAEDDLYGLRLSLLLQGSTAMASGDLDRAKKLNGEAVEVARRFGLGRELAVSLQNLAGVFLRAGEYAEAEALLREALAASRRDPSYYFAATGLSYLADAVGHMGRPLVAARFLGAAEGLAELIGFAFFPLDRERMARFVPDFREAAGEKAFEAARTEGRRLGLDAVLAEVEAGSETVADPVVTPVRSEPAHPATAPPPQLDIRLLGGFQVRVEGADLPAERWSYSKPRELLAHLVQRPEGAPRDRIAGALWPDAPPGSLKNSFHVTLHHLRKALGKAEWIVLEGDRYRIAPGVAVRVDARRFEESARAVLSRVREMERAGNADRKVAEELAEGLHLYRGDLLDGEVAAPWAEEWRDRLRALAGDLRMALGRTHEALGELPAASGAYAAAAGAEPFREEAHRGLMRCWAASGERARALAHYESVESLLRDQLDVTPDPETLTLVGELRSDGQNRQT